MLISNYDKFFSLFFRLIWISTRSDYIYGYILNVKGFYFNQKPIPIHYWQVIIEEICFLKWLRFLVVCQFYITKVRGKVLRGHMLLMKVQIVCCCPLWKNFSWGPKLACLVIWRLVAKNLSTKNVPFATWLDPKSWSFQLC